MLATLTHITDGHLDLAAPSGTWSFGDPASSRRASARLNDERVFRRVLFGGDIGFGEAYMDGDWSTDDLVALLRLAIRNLALFEDRNRLLSAVSRWRNLLSHRRKPNSRRGSRANIRAHYDLGNDFYRLFLDESMAYSCAIFRTADDTLEEAQARSSTGSAGSCDSARPTTCSRSAPAGAGSPSGPPRATAAASRPRRSAPSSTRARPTCSPGSASGRIGSTSCSRTIAT